VYGLATELMKNSAQETHENELNLPSAANNICKLARVMMNSS